MDDITTDESPSLDLSEAARQFVTQEEEAPGETEQPADPPEGVKSDRARERFQQLANDRRELLQENQQLKELVDALKADHELRKEQWNYQQNLVQQHQKNLETTNKAKTMMEVGLDPYNKNEVFMYDQFLYAKQLEDELRGIRDELSQFRAAKQETTLESSLRDQLKGYQVDDRVFTALREVAQETWRANNLPPEKAAAAAVDRLKVLLRPKAQSGVPADEMAAHRAVSTSGPSAGRAPGRRPQTLKEAASALYEP